jgi:DNA-binding NtrC family response regulator
LESELFGHIRGAFTGADSSRVGRLEAAHRGTIFLDDIGELSPSIQLKLLRVLQERVIERLGENRPRRVDVRIIAATNRDLRREVQAGRFREDLFHRINVLTLKAPALRQRPDDIPLLVHHFIQVLNQSLGKNISGCSREALEALFRYPWPGNVRELRNALEYAFVLARGSTIELQDLPHFVASARLQEPGLSETTQSQKEELLRALEACGWNQTRAAKLLGISRVTVWNRMIRFGIERPGRRGPRQAG